MQRRTTTRRSAELSTRTTKRSRGCTSMAWCTRLQMPPPDETVPQYGAVSSGPHSDTSWVNMIGVGAVERYPDEHAFTHDPARDRRDAAEYRRGAAWDSPDSARDGRRIRRTAPPRIDLTWWKRGLAPPASGRSSRDGPSRHAADRR